MIKPDAVSDGFSGPIIQQIEEAGFRIVAIKKTTLSPEEAGRFYAVHAERPFYQSLCDYMSSNAIIPMVLEKENAVEEFRTLIGSTNPAQAAEGTIRKRFARSLESNAIHGSDSDENAAIESAFFFTSKELEA
jgi:nucleoside-diphosphate kinase